MKNHPRRNYFLQRREERRLAAAETTPGASDEARYTASGGAAASGQTQGSSSMNDNNNNRGDDDPDQPKLEIGELARLHEDPHSGVTRRKEMLNKETSSILKDAIKVTVESVESLKRSEMIAHSAEEMGLGAMKQLQIQQEVHDRVDSQLDRLPSTFERIRMEMWSITKNLYKDKCFVILCMCVTAAIVLLVVLLIRKYAEDDGGGGESEATTAAPARIR